MKQTEDHSFEWQYAIVEFIGGSIVGPFITCILFYLFLAIFQAPVLKDGQWGLVLLPTALLGAIVGGVVGAIIVGKTSVSD